VLVLAESEGRSDQPAGFPARQRASIRRALIHLTSFWPAMSHWAWPLRRLATGFAWLEAGVDFVTETELFAAGPTLRRRKKQEQVSDVERADQGPVAS